MRKTILLFCLVIVATSWAQKNVVDGTVIDARSGDPIVGASVTALGLSVVTNADGYFTLKSDSKVSAITVSHVGYKSSRVGVSDKPIRIRLLPTTIKLNEVLVMGTDLLELVKTAISKIPQNYSLQPENYHCFYRETAMKRQRYICVAEGVVDMYKSGYDRQIGRDRVAIRKGRRLLSPKLSDTLSVKVLGGPVAPVQLDLVKNTEILLNIKELDCYNLKMEVPTTLNDRQQYVVSISPRLVMPYALYYGTLYIDKETLAFTRAELSLDMSDRWKATEQMLVKKPSGVRFRPKELSLLIDYRQGADGLSRISYLRTTFRFNCDWRRRLFATSFTAVCELAVTNTTNSNVLPIKGRESFDQRDAFFDRVDYFRDPAFWQDYNIIEPTESLDKAVHRLLKKY